MSRVNRRDALKALVVVGASAAAAGCSRPAPGEAQKAAAEPPAILAVQPLASPWQTLDPFLFCVHHDDAYPAGNERFGPAASLCGRNIGMDFEGKDGWRMYHGDVVPGFPQHPHRGFETVTVVRRGLLDHSDSLGATARYGGGDVQWLTAGKGVLHAEMFPLLDRQRPNPLELFQIWLNLPSADKFADPHFKMLWNEAVPRRKERDAAGRETELTLVAGRLGEDKAPAPPPSSWASREDSDVAIWTLRMAPGARWTLPPAHEGTHRMLYFFSGEALRVAGEEIPPAHAVQLRGDAAVSLESGDDEVEALLLQGRPIKEPVARRGPFVMNTQEEIAQAYADYRRTRFGGWRWERPDPVHGDEGRFARHADGSSERPT
jgi:quercetin 2,3-dioxygenase